MRRAIVGALVMVVLTIGAFSAFAAWLVLCVRVLGPEPGLAVAVGVPVLLLAALAGAVIYRG